MQETLLRIAMITSAFSARSGLIATDTTLHVLVGSLRVGGPDPWP